MVFQFLIGTITPGEMAQALVRKMLVSIPHRYDKPSISHHGHSFYLDIVSIPHRYDKPL